MTRNIKEKIFKTAGIVQKEVCFNGPSPSMNAWIGASAVALDWLMHLKLP